jgi:polysaccharide biosynthesis PFTS motif protein
MIQKKIVFFEEINGAYNSILFKYLEKGFLVYYFRMDEKYGKKEKIQRKVDSTEIKDLSSKNFEYSLSRKASSLAHENVDDIFDKFFSSSPSIANMIKLLDFPEVVDAYKKELLLKLGEIYVIQLKINTIIKNTSPSQIDFIPNEDYEIHSDSTSLLNKKIEIIKYSNVRIKIKNFFERLFTDNIKSPKKGLLPLFYPIYLFFKKFKGISNEKNPRKFKVGISVNHPRGLFEMNYHYNAILIDNKNLPKEDVLFIDESGDINIKEYKKRGYNFTKLRDDREGISLDLLSKIIKTFLPIWFKTLYLSLLKEPTFIDSKRRILQDYILWNIFIEKYKIDNYVRQALPDDISKIHLLTQNGIVTWFIFPDCSSVDFYLNWDRSLKNLTLHSFMFYDNAIVYGKVIERLLKKHRNNIKNYIKVGILYSQIIHELEEGKLKSSLPSIIQGKKMPVKIIGVFDTSYGGEAPLKIIDGIRFGEEILRLLDEYSNIGVIFKAKKEVELTPFLIPIYEKLKKHNRCIFIARYDETGISFPEVIAVSDLVISASFTSPSGEALGARKKAFYYDVAGYYVGEGYYYNRFPNFVAHSFEELKKLVNYWLYEVTDEEFNNFLNTYVKDEIDPYLDGKALSRVRKLLMSEEPS